MHIKTLLAFAMLGCLWGIATADDIGMPAADTATSSAPPDLPLRGSTMNKVEAKFGAPAQREAAVGRPPITRWDYANFIVYFEGDHVIHSVVR